MELLPVENVLEVFLMLTNQLYDRLFLRQFLDEHTLEIGCLDFLHKNLLGVSAGILVRD